MAAGANMKMLAAGLLVRVLGPVVDLCMKAAALFAGSSRRFRLVLMGGVAAMVATGIIWAAVSGGGKAAKASTVYATIVKVDPAASVVRIAVMSNDEERKDRLAIRFSGQTRTVIEGKPAAVTDLKPNQFVAITLDSGMATRIEGRARRH